MIERMAMMRAGLEAIAERSRPQGQLVRAQSATNNFGQLHTNTNTSTDERVVTCILPSAILANGACPI